MLKTRHDLVKTWWGSTITVPKGTRVRLIKNADGLRGDLFAIDDVRLLVGLTGNTHDPYYRYAVVEPEEVADDASLASF